MSGDKDSNISQMIHNRSWEDIEAEMAKCDIVCHNCHAERTYQRQIKSGSQAAGKTLGIEYEDVMSETYSGIV